MDFKTPNRLDSVQKTPQRTPSLQANGVDTPKTSNGYSNEPSKRHKGKSFGARIIKWVATLVAILVCFVGAWFMRNLIVYQGIDTVRYQAVYLDNSNVYFGKVTYLMNGNILLKDVFRVEANKTSTSQSSTSTAQSSSSIRLIKPGKELHAPDDTMLINKGKVLYIENLKTTGEVAKAIASFHKENDPTK